MSLHRFRALVALLGFAGVLAAASLVVGDEPPKDDPAAQDKQVVDSDVTHKPGAASVKFKKQLNLPFNSLDTLGSRIASARHAHDPVALAHAASELHVAEQVSGKTASITSTQLLKESAELAALKRQVAELEAVSRVADQVQQQSQVATILQQNLALAKQQVNADKAAIQTNEEPTWKVRKLVVNNYGTDYVDMYVNGNFKVTIAPGMQQTCYIEHRWNPVVVTAYGNQDVDTWGPRYIWGRWDKYTWNIR
jgi:hypothetical protein